jgi:phage terminase small subunit
MSDKLTIKQGNFCLAYIETGNATEAFRRVYTCGRMKPETINRNAFKLTENSKIVARLAVLREAITERHNVTVDSLIIELEEARDIAKNSGSAMAMVQATMGKAKLCGLDGKRDDDDDGLAGPVYIGFQQNVTALNNR